MSESAANNVVGLNIPGEPQYLSLIRLVTTHLAETAGFAEEDVGKIEIAVDEACTNVIEHAYATLPPKPPIRLEIQATPDQFIVDIVDQGGSFDFDGYVAPKFPDHWNEGHTRGVGVYLIQKCMDEAFYMRLPDQRNRMRLVKRLRPAPA